MIYLSLIQVHFLLPQFFLNRNEERKNADLQEATGHSVTFIHIDIKHQTIGRENQQVSNSFNILQNIVYIKKM